MMPLKLSITCRMITATSLLFAAFVLCSNTLFGQNPDAELRQLMSRRADLLQQWRRFNLEENALFGGKSKRDLKKVVETQQRIIELDNRILNFGKLENYEKKKAEKKENLQLRKSLYGRIDSVETLTSRYEEQLSAAAKRENALRAGIARQQSMNKELSIALVLVTGLLLFSLFYNPFRRKKKR